MKSTKINEEKIDMKKEKKKKKDSKRKRKNCR